MDVQKSAERFDQAVSSLCPALSRILLDIPASAKASAYEVRLRVGRPIVLTCKGRSWFVDGKSQLHNLPQSTYIVTRNDIADCVVSMCAWSVHSHQNEMKNGFISLRGGHRAGVCGTAVTDGETVTAVRDVTSVNLRVARDIHGVAAPLMRAIFTKNLTGALIVGIPSSGKTTVLRDLARQLAGGASGRFYKVAVIDERGEIGAVCEGIPQNDLGPCCDILTGYPKGAGILTAVRTLSPEVILCDEIGGEEEAVRMLEGVNCGVKMVATAHAKDPAELMGRPQIVRLLEHGVFQRIVWLRDADNPGTISEITKAGELLGKGGGNGAAGFVLDHGGDAARFGIGQKGGGGGKEHSASAFYL